MDGTEQYGCNNKGTAFMGFAELTLGAHIFNKKDVLLNGSISEQIVGEIMMKHNFNPFKAYLTCQKRFNVTNLTWNPAGKGKFHRQRDSPGLVAGVCFRPLFDSAIDPRSSGSVLRPKPAATRLHLKGN